MTTVNMTITSGGTITQGAPYSAGSFDASGCLDPLTLILTPITSGTSTPSQNVTTVFASTGGGSLAVNQGSPVDPAHDGSQTKIVYYESSMDDGPSTSHQKIAIASKATVQINQLSAGRWTPMSSVQVDHPGMAAGAAVQLSGGTWIVLPSFGAPTTIEAAANSLTWLDGAVFDGHLTVTLDIDRGSTWALTDVVVNGEHAALVAESGGAGSGFAIKGYTAAQMTARMTVRSIWGSNYLDFK